MTMDEQGSSVSPQPSQPRSEGRARWWVRPWVTGVAGLVVGAGVVGGVWALTGASAGAFALHGTLELTDGSQPTDADTVKCAGSGGYDDIVTGASVTVYGASGQVVATGSLGQGKYQGGDSTTPCTFHFTVSGVPRGERFYQVEVSHRGKITTSATKAENSGVHASLG